MQINKKIEICGMSICFVFLIIGAIYNLVSYSNHNKSNNILSYLNNTGYIKVDSDNSLNQQYYVRKKFDLYSYNKYDLIIYSKPQSLLFKHNDNEINCTEFETTISNNEVTLDSLFDTIDHSDPYIHAGKYGYTPHDNLNKIIETVCKSIKL